MCCSTSTWNSRIWDHVNLFNTALWDDIEGNLEGGEGGKGERARGGGGEDDDDDCDTTPLNVLSGPGGGLECRRQQLLRCDMSRPRDMTRSIDMIHSCVCMTWCFHVCSTSVTAGAQV